MIEHRSGDDLDTGALGSNELDPDGPPPPASHAKDVHEDPFVVGGSAHIVLRCADCGEEKEIGGTRRDFAANQRFDQRAADALCINCFAIALRVWGEKHPQVSLARLGPESVTDTDPDMIGSGPARHAVRRLCPRCGGTGMTQWGFCFDCLGERWCYVDVTNVRRVARWWQTFQQSRVPSPDPAAGTNTP